MAQPDSQADRRTIFRAWLIVSIAAIGLSSLLAQRPTIRADVDLVVVPTSVKNTQGRFVYDLKQEDFTIFEDGRQQQIQQFSIDPVPLSTVVLVDTGIACRYSMQQRQAFRVLQTPRAEMFIREERLPGCRTPLRESRSRRGMSMCSAMSPTMR